MSAISFFRASARRIPTVALGAFMALAGLSGCSTSPVLHAITPYKVDVIQGNAVSREQVADLKVGMTRDQVGEIMGTPLLVSAFHADRWDYVFTIRRQGVADQSRRLTIYFQGDKMTRFEGDPMPAEQEFINSIASERRFSLINSSPKLQLSPVEIDEIVKNRAR